jgi:hypothetical protein
VLHPRVLSTVLVASLVAIAAGVTTAEALSSQPAGADAITLPELQVLVPTASISIGTNPSTSHRQLQFTHITWDAGTGPFAIQPTFDASTGLSSVSQVLYHQSSSGWAVDHSVPLALDGVFESPNRFRYPLTRFTLNEVNPDGSIGAIVGVSPKTDFCISGDAFVGGVPNTPPSSSPPLSDCSSPDQLLGYSVGWGDKYDQTDNGQPIDLTGVPDGTYILRATVDPQHLFAESDNTNDVLDTKLQITGTTVTVVSQTSPRIVPPVVALTSPAAGAQVSGTVTLEATASATRPATVASVQYLVNGVPIGPLLTAAPYRYAWSVGPIPGTRTLSARVTDSASVVGTAPVETVREFRSSSGLSFDVSRSAIGLGTIQTGAFSTSVAGDTLVAFAGLDGPGSATQTTKVTGLGLTWRLVRRANSQAGDAEIWTTRAPSVVRRVRVTSTPAFGGYAQQLFVVAMSGAAGIGATGMASGPNGPPSVLLTTKGAGSYVMSVGNDWTDAIARTLSSGQTLFGGWVDSTHKNTFWEQGPPRPVRLAGSKVVLGDTAPVTDRWNMAAMEVRAAPPPKPSIVIDSPVSGQTISSFTALSASVNDAAAIRTVRYFVDGRQVGATISGPSLALPHWDSRSVPDGRHTLSVRATDAQGRTLRSRVDLRVVNPQPAMTCFVLEANVSASGGRMVTAPLLHVASVHERLVAFVTSSPGASLGSVTSRAPLAWHLLRFQRGTGGDVAVWTAVTARTTRTVQVSSTIRWGTQDLTVIDMQGTAGVGSIVAGTGSVGRAMSLVTGHSTSLVFAVGVQSGPAAPAAHGWAAVSSHGGGAHGLASWVQYTNWPTGAPGARVAIPQSRTPHRGWTIVAFELPGDD